MSSSYTQLTESDLKLEKELSSLKPTILTPIPQPQPQLTGFKAAMIGAYFIGMLGLLGGLYTYYSLLLEAKQRKSLEISHAALSGRTLSMESAIEEQKVLVSQLGDKLSTSLNKEDAIRNEIRREIEKRRLEILNIQKKMNAIEQQVANPQQAATDIPMAPVESVQAVTAMAKPAELSAKAAVAAPAPQAAGKERVLTINRQFKFVVINIGTTEGAKVGDKFSVMRGDEVIGQVQIEKLYDSFSAATILEESSGSAMEVGDGIAKIS